MWNKKSVSFLEAILIVVMFFDVRVHAVHFEHIKQITQLSKTLVPVLIVGSGVSGLSAAIYTARAQLHTVVMAGNEPGGQLMGSSLVENMPGVMAVPGYKVIDHMEQQAKAVGVHMLHDTVRTIDVASEGNYFIVQTENDLTLHALTIIIATGASPNKLHVPGEVEFTNTGVFTCAVCDCRQATGKEVVVVGGGDSAIESVMHLAPYAKHITLLVRGKQMRASLAMQEKLKKYDHVAVLYQQRVLKIVGAAPVQEPSGTKNTDENSPWMSGVVIQHADNQETKLLSAECVFVAIGHTPNSRLFTPLVAVDRNGYILLQGRTQLTSLQGIFAAGDVTDPRYKQAGRASGDAIAAGLDAISYLHDKGFSVVQAQELAPYYFKNVAVDAEEI